MKKLRDYFNELKKTIVYALGLSILIYGLLSYINFNDLELDKFIGGSIFLLICYIGLFSAYFLRKYIKEDNPLYVIIRLMYKNYKSFIFFFLIWIIMHISMSAADFFEKMGRNVSVEFFDSRKVGASLAGCIMFCFTPYWITKVIIGIINKTKHNKFIWSNNKMLKLIPIVLLIIFICFIFAPKLYGY